MATSTQGALSDLFWSVLLAGELWLDGETRKYLYPEMNEAIRWLGWSWDSIGDAKESGVQELYL